MLKKQYNKTKPVCKVTFSLPKEAANSAKEVKVVGDFNNWSWENGFAMKANKTNFSTAVELEAGRAYQFRYMIDNQKWENDWAADAYQPSPFDGVDNSVVVLDEVKVAAPAKAKKAAPAKKATTVKKAAPAKKATTVKKATPAKKATTAKKTTTVKKATTAKKATPVKKATTAKKAVATKKATTKTVSTKDNLKKIEGIGPKIEKLLNAKGINTFNDLAKAKITLLKTTLDEAGPRFKMHNPTTWAEQAKLAAKGAWDKLGKLQEELKGGKR